MDPHYAERLIYKVLAAALSLTWTPKPHLLPSKYLLTALIADQHLDDAGLDAFLAQARKLADQWLA